MQEEKTMLGRFTRRRFLSSAAGVAGATVLGAAASATPALTERAEAAPARGQRTLNLICWAGYNDPLFVKPFERMYNCKVTGINPNTSDQMFAKWKASGGRTYDLISASGDVTRRLMRSRTLLEIDTAKLPNFNQLYPKFHFPEWNTMNGKRYGVSFTWGPDSLIYDLKTFATPPTSWGVLYDKRYKGKLSTADNPITIADVALYLGYQDCYNLTTAQLAQVKKTLQAQKPLLRLYWGASTDLENAFIHHEVVASNAWPLMTNDLRAAHFPVGETIPKEGATGWADTWMIAKDSPNVDLAYKWIDYMIGPQGQQGVIKVTGYSGASKAAVPHLTKAQVKDLHMGDLAYFDKLHMWTEPANYGDWVTLWNDVKG